MYPTEPPEPTCRQERTGPELERDYLKERTISSSTEVSSHLRKGLECRTETCVPFYIQHKTKNEKRNSPRYLCYYRNSESYGLVLVGPKGTLDREYHKNHRDRYMTDKVVRTL